MVEKALIALAGPSLTQHQGQVSTPEVTLASLGGQIATIVFPSVKSNQNQHMFTDTCQALNKYLWENTKKKKEYLMPAL